MTGDSRFLLPELATPEAQAFGLDAPFWDATRQGRLFVQQCSSCGGWQWGPEWICRRCRSFDVAWVEVPPTNGQYEAVVYSWERVWHPANPILADAVPYVVLLAEMPAAGGIRMLGNLVGDQRAELPIGSPLRAVFEHHDSHTLVQWERI